MPFLGGRYFGEASVVIHMMHLNRESYTFYFEFFAICRGFPCGQTLPLLLAGSCSKVSNWEFSSIGGRRK